MVFARWNVSSTVPLAVPSRCCLGVLPRGPLARAVISALAAFALWLLTASVLATTARAASEPSGTEAGGCPKVIVYFARGSGQKLNATASGFGRPGQQLFEALEQRYGRGVVGRMADAYPASSVFSFFTGRYFESAASGAQSAVQNITDITVLCPASWLVLGGFSQGAQAIRTALAELNGSSRERVAAVILFGDPYFDPSESTVVELSSYDRRGDLLHRPVRGLLRNSFPSRAPAIGAAYAGRVFSWCHARDQVCQTVGSFASHGTYDENVGEAVARVAERLSEVGLSRELAAGARKPGTPYRVRGTCLTGTCGLAEWSGPGTSSFQATGAFHEGQEVRVLCQLRGEQVLGPSGSTSAIWDRLTDEDFVSDLYLDTPAVGRFSSTLPQCTPLVVENAGGEQ